MRRSGLFAGVVLGIMVMAVWSYAGELSQILFYDASDTQMTGVGIQTFKLMVGEEMTITAKGVDKDGNDVPIWPTWKADKELSIKVVEGRSKTVVLKASEAGVPVFFYAIYITDDGKKVVGEAMGEIKPKPAGK